MYFVQLNYSEEKFNPARETDHFKVRIGQPSSVQKTQNEQEKNLAEFSDY